jgi:putative DNA primase/helicase
MGMAASHLDVERQFLDAILAFGIGPAKNVNFQADGRIHRYRVEGDKAGSKNGWYVLYVDGAVPAGAFGSWKTGESGTWSAKAEHAMSQQERDELRWKMQEAKLARERELQQVRAEARAKAEKLWGIATPAAAGRADAGGSDSSADVHPYLLTKGIKPYGVRRLKTMLVVPVRATDGRLISLQFIGPDGSKRFVTGGEVAGGYHAIGKPEGTLLICEGFATGASLREATGFAVAVAFNAGNLLPVAKAMREKFPALRIVICADNDQFTEGNPGRSRARSAAETVGGLVAEPMFDLHELASKPTDFNDLHRMRGLDAVKAAILAACENVVPIAAARSRKDMEKLIDESEDFDQLTGPVAAQVRSSGLPVPAREMLLSKIAKKAGVPKSSLVLDGDSSGGGGKPPKRDDDRDWLAELNEKHAVIPIGGKIMILNREWDPVMGRPLLTFSDRTNFENRYCNRKVWERGEEVPVGKWWMEHPKRREYDGMVFSPGQDVPGYLNLWQGWGVEPKAGCCRLFLDFVQEVICNNDNELYNYVMSWCAFMIQFPAQLPETAIVLRGREGIGKNTFVDALRDIVGQAHYLLLSSLNQVTGRFSGQLAKALLVFCNESVWGGDKSAQGVLKSMITDDVQPVEHKGRDIVMVRSCRHLIFSTNEHWAVPRGADDRRYVIADVSDKRKGDFAYFKRIRDGLRNGGIEALFQWLLDQDLTGWHPRNVPKQLQENGWELKIQSGGSIVKWWFDVLRRGWIYQEEREYAEENRDAWPSMARLERVQANYVNWCTQYRIHHIEHSTVVGRELHDWGLRNCRPRKDNDGRKEFYKLPPLDEAREIFAVRFSLPVTVWDGHVVDEAKA